MLASLLLVAAAPVAQQDFFLDRLTPVARPGQLTQTVTYGPSFTSGWELDSNGVRRAVRYDENGASFVGTPMPGGNAEGAGTDVSGNVVGWSEDMVAGNVIRRPFIDYPSFGTQIIDLPGTEEGWATSISIFGHNVVGTMRNSDGSLQAWDWDQFFQGSAVALSTPNGWESEALAVDDQYAGGLVRDPQGREFAAVWDFQRTLTVLSTPGSGNARVTGVGIAGSDIVCGWYLDAAGLPQGFLVDLKDPQGSFMTLPTLGGAWTQPSATDGFRVVGSSANAQGEARAFVYSMLTQEMTDLNDRVALPSGAVLTECSSVEFGPVFAVNGSANGFGFGAAGRKVLLSVSTLLAGSQATMSVTNAPVDSLAAFVYGFNAGMTAVPGCPGLFADIANAQVLVKERTTSLGTTFHFAQVPPQAAGLTVLVQCVFPEECLTTEVATREVL